MRGVFLLLILLISLNLNAQEIKKNKEDILKITKNDIVVGSEDAPVTIIEYSSLSCPHCARIYLNVILKLKAKYIDSGKVKYIHRDLPLNEQALQASILNHCVPKDRFYVFHEVLFRSQKGWSLSRNYIEQLENIGKLGGLSAQEFMKCQNDQDLINRVLNYKLEAIQYLGIKATPTLFINNQLVNSPLTEDRISDIIELELKKPSK